MAFLSVGIGGFLGISGIILFFVVLIEQFLKLFLIVILIIVVLGTALTTGNTLGFVRWGLG